MKLITSDTLTNRYFAVADEHLQIGTDTVMPKMRTYHQAHQWIKAANPETCDRLANEAHELRHPSTRRDNGKTQR